MSAVRDVWADLVEKRLWPLAVVLVIALVALPLFARKPAPATKTATVTPMADTGPAPMVSDPAQLASSRPAGTVAGARKNPFEQQHVPKKDSTSTSSSSSAGPGTASTTSSGGTGSSSGGGTSSGGGDSTTSTPQSKPKDEGVTELKVRFGRSDAKRKVRTLSPGAPLPTVSNPLLVFVDVRKGNRAEFVVSSDALPQGDGRCEPSKTVCAQLFLKRGQTEFFDVTTENGTVQYQLDVLDVVTK